MATCHPDRRANTLDGLCNLCYRRAHYLKNKEKTLAVNAAYRAKNQDSIKNWQHENYWKDPMLSRRKKNESIAKHRESINTKRREKYRTDPNRRLQVKVSARRYRSENRDKYRESKRRYSANNRDRVNAVSREWVANNLERRRATARRWTKKFRSTPEGRIHCRISRAISHSLHEIGIKKNGRTWPSLVGYTAEELKRHLESQFTAGMTWRRLLAGEIEIDHIVPKSKFTFNSTDDMEFRRCWALENLRPLWAEANQSRGNKITEPAQIALGV